MDFPDRMKEKDAWMDGGWVEHNYVFQPHETKIMTESGYIPKEIEDERGKIFKIVKNAE